MSRHWISPLSILLLLPTMAALADDVPTPAIAQPSVTAVDKLDEGLKIGQQAESFDALVRVTKPKFVWRDRDMLWITHDESGKVGFMMNRAYDLQIASATPACFLLDAHNYCHKTEGPAFLYTRFVDPQPMIVARDPVRGVVYQVHWNSSPADGSGSITQTRNIFLLCDGRHRWHLLGEGPVGSSGHLGAIEYIADSVQADVTWNNDPSSPVKLTFTLLTRDDWELAGGELDTPDHRSLTICRTMVPAVADSGGLADGISPEDLSPGAFRRQGPCYVIASKTEPLKDFLRQLAHRCSEVPIAPDGNSRDTRTSQAASKALIALNPFLAATVPAGAKIVLPEWFHASEDDSYSPPPTPDFYAIHFVDRENGWAETDFEILRTADGGRTWKKVAPSGPIMDCGVAFATCNSVFGDSSTAWIAYPRKNESATVHFRRTTDGGEHWSGDDFTAPNVSDLEESNLTFSDENHGWLMLGPDHGMSSSPGTLFRTKDGGATWGEVASTNDRLPHSGAIIFRDASTGWLVGADTTTGPVTLSITRDGGRTWKLQPLTPPAGLVHDEQIEPTALPIFFDAVKKNAILTARLYRPGDSLYDSGPWTIIYGTHDGGQTWRPTTPLNAVDGVSSFANTEVGWVWASNFSYSRIPKSVTGNLWNSQNGGKTWSKINIDAALLDCLAHEQDIERLDFLDSEYGWAFLRSKDSRVRTLLQTTDGGNTWIDLNATELP
jgi:hypothetical protein